MQHYAEVQGELATEAWRKRGIKLDERPDAWRRYSGEHGSGLK